MIKAVLFDNDGVLVDTERLFFESTKNAFAKYGFLISQNDWALWYLSEGKRSKEIGKQFRLSDSKIDEILNYRNELFWFKVNIGVKIQNNVLAVIQKLSAKYKLAIVSGAGKIHLDRVHKSTDLLKYFSCIVTREMYENDKPCPDCYHKAIELLSVDANECIAVEDSPRGAKAAVLANVKCIVIPTFLTRIDLCPKECIVLKDISEIFNFVG